MSAFEPILAAAGRALRPLQRAATDPEALRHVLADCGWDVVVAVEDLDVVQSLLPFDAIDRAVELGEKYADGVPLTVSDLDDLIEVIEQIVSAIDAWSQLAVDDLSGLSAVLADPGLWADLAASLAEYLLLRVLDGDLPAIALVARLTGIVEWEVREPFRRLGRWRLRWERISDLFADPIGAMKDATGWPSVDSADQILAIVGRALGRFAIPVTSVTMSDPVRDAIATDGHGDPTALTQMELRLARGQIADGSPFQAGIVAASAATVSEPAGVYIGNICAGAVAAGASWGIWTLEVTGEVDGEASIGVVIRPGSANPITDLPSGEVSLTLTGSPPVPWRLFGTATGTRIELGGLEIGAGITIDGAQSEPWLSIGATGNGLAAVLDLGGADSFLGSVLGGITPTFSVPGTVRLGSHSGLTVAAGSLGLDFEIPIGRTLGPVYLDSITIGIGASASELHLDIGADMDLIVGPFTATAAGIGASFVVALGTSGGSAFGGLDASLAFKPPTAIGLTLETEAASGGGMIWIDPELGRYSGALSLDIVAIGIDAIVVIDTQLPGNPDGWAFFASLAAQFPGIPLGFGFVLLGAGGLIALNRTMDAEALSAGLRSGVVDTLLFPDDPLGDSAELIAQIDEYFPLAEGSTVIGPVVQIGWGSPALITAQLGVVISLPDDVIAVLGSVEATLPTPEQAILSLHMDVLGVIDVPGGSFSLLGSLYDSQLLDVIQLSGDLAMYLQVGSQPYFLLSVGGYHPGFQPPSLVPASMHDLRRMQASIEIASNLSVSVQAYFAVTSNTIQFGCSVNVVASVEVLLTTYTAKGWFTFDVLLVFSPFKLSAAMSAGVGIYAGGKELMGVQLALLLEGPKPWYAIGTASFKFFGLKVAFDLEVGGKAAGEPKPVAHPRADVLAALAVSAAWFEVAPAEPVFSLITYSPQDPLDTTTWVRPDHQVAVRQTVAPLNRTLAVVGQSVPAPGEELLTLSDATLGDGSVAWQIADDWFAPAQFEDLSGTDKLGRASFELMPAGVTFGAPGAAITGRRKLNNSVTTEFDTATFTPEDDSLATAVLTSAATVGLRYTAPATTPVFVVAASTYTVVRTVDGVEAGDVLADVGAPSGGVNQYSALAARRSAVAADATRASKLTVIPTAGARA